MKNSKSKSKTNEYFAGGVGKPTAPRQAEVDALIDHFGKGRYEMAKALALAMTRNHPRSPFGWKALGAIYGQTGNLPESLLPMRKAVELMPRDAEAHCNLAVVLNDLGRPEEAEASCRRAIALNPGYAEAYCNLGVVLNGQGKVEEAEASLRRATALKPGYAEAHCNLAAVLTRLGRLEDAEANCRRAIALKPGYAEAHCNLAAVLNDLDRADEAVACCKQAISLKANYAEAYSNLGNALSHLRQMEEALACYRQAIELNPRNAEPRNNLGNAFKLQGCPREAETGFRQALELDSEHMESLINLGFLLMDQGRLTDAQSCLERGLSRFSGGKWPIAGVALTAYWLLGLESEARALIEQYAGFVPRSRAFKFHPQQTFFNYISSLLGHKFAHAELYEAGNGEVPLVVLGESHCLGLDNLRIAWVDGVRVSASCRFVSGVKMFHLGSASDKHYSMFLSGRLNSIEPSSHLLFTIGEIDCRPDEGIWKAFHQGKGPLPRLVESTVDGYLNWLSRELALHSFPSVTLQGIPAPNYLSREKYAATDKAGFLAMIREVNLGIEKGAHSRGWRYLDVYSATAGEAGMSNGKWHLDGHHLQPRFYCDEARKWIR